MRRQLVLLALILSVGTTTRADDLQTWFEETKSIQKKYRQTIPEKVSSLLKKKHPSFRPFTFDIDPSEIARGDFNCDGKEDYAIVGVDKGNTLIQAFDGGGAPANYELVKKEYDTLNFGSPAKVMVILSSSKGFLVKEEPGSYVRASDSCGCCNSTTPADSEWIKKSKCKWLYIGCCEKDGGYTIFQKDSLESRFEDGC
jgi:hypothetical protein